MKKNKRWLAALLCLALMLAMTACQKAEVTSFDSSEETTVESTRSAEAEQTAKETTKEKKEEKQKTETTKAKATTAKKESKAASARETKKSTKAAKKETTKKKTENKKPSGHVLTIKKGSEKVYFTEKQLSAMGKATYKYSYRNKESQHRQFASYSGVKFSSVLNKSGLSGSTARFISSDGYTKEFSVGELTSSKKAFLKTTGSSAKSVPAILTLGDSTSFRLVFGQAASDTDEEGDYNANQWVKWIDTIELY